MTLKQTKDTLVKFSQVLVGQYFFDHSASGMWMRKIDDETARWSDGLIACLDRDTTVYVETA